MAQTPEERAFKKIADIFADERLNVVQLGYFSATGFTPSMIERVKGWLHWHDQIADSIELRDDGGYSYLDGEYLKYIDRNRRG